MKPKACSQKDLQGDLFQVELERLVTADHPLVKLSREIDWGGFEKQLSPHYCEGKGRPAIPTRLMVGLHYLKHTYNLSDEEVVARWVENPYWQHFCGSKWFEHGLPIDPSSMTRWRNKVGEDGLEALLAETLRVGVESKVLRASSFDHVNVDTTVQEKAIAFPTDSRLYDRMREGLVRLAKESGVVLRQSYIRVARQALVKVGRYAHAKQFRRMRRWVKKLKTYLGRVMRDIERKIAGNPQLEAHFERMLSLARRIHTQRRQDKNKVYSVHAPEVECIAKGKAHKRYEFGNKVGFITTSREGFILAAKAFHGNPYDGHTLKACLDQAERVSDRSITGHVFADRGYRKHDYAGPASVHLAGRSTKKMKRSFRRWYRRRSAIEPIIGHMKTDGRLGRNYLLGKPGDAINAILSGCGQNLRLLLGSRPFARRIFLFLYRLTLRLRPCPSRTFFHAAA